MPDDSHANRGSGKIAGRLPEEYACAVLLAGMAVMMFVNAGVRNIGWLGRTHFATWLAHGIEVLPSGLVWLTFLGAGAVTRRGGLLRIDVLTHRLSVRRQRFLERLTLRLWAAFFAVLLVLGTAAAWQQRHQTTSIHWLPAWAVALSVPVGSLLVVVRALQRLRELRDAAGDAASAGRESSPAASGGGP